jgi:hypothetical protein
MGPRFLSFWLFWFLSVFSGFCRFLGFRNQWKLKCRITDVVVGLIGMTLASNLTQFILVKLSQARAMRACT